MLKAIETVYNGYRFRSRLEARWAVFFDELGIEYEYEPEGFDLGKAGKYLPDFWLPTFSNGMFCEVKFKGGDMSKPYALCLASGYSVWLCDGIPDFAEYKVLCREKIKLCETSDGVVSDFLVIELTGIPNVNAARHQNRMYWQPQEYEIEDAMNDPCYRNAVFAARQARFEHGQIGSPRNW